MKYLDNHEGKKSKEISFYGNLKRIMSASKVKI